MAIYHANLKNFSRGKGDSSLAAAAYRAGLDLMDTKSRDWHRYSQRRGVDAVHMLAPAGSPQWCSDAKSFWDANEHGETRKNSLVARELEVSLPHELSSAQREVLAIALGQLLVDRYHCVVMVAIHAPVGGSDTRNHHTHLLMSSRKVGPKGLGERAGGAFDARGGKGAEEVRAVRELVGGLINAHLSRAGIEQAVDHRSLKDQAKAAAARGDHQAAIRLTRPPTKHVGKVATHASRGTVETEMEQAIAAAAARGVLVATPAQHSHGSAMAERLAARHANPPQKVPVVWGRPVRPRKAGQPSYTALRLGRLGRITRAQGGNGADVLNAEAELIEHWLAAQTAAAEAALDSVQEIPGIRLEPVFVDALASLRTRRVAVYGTKPSLFEDTEALSWAIQNYAAELRRPHDKRQRLATALVRVSEAENPADPAPKDDVLRARRELFKAKGGVSQLAMIECERRLNQARELMANAREGIERDFHITKVAPIEPDPFGAFAQDGNGQRKSDSNRRQLKPSPPGSLGMR
jgi:MobA/MobL family